MKTLIIVVVSFIVIAIFNISIMFTEIEILGFNLGAILLALEISYLIFSLGTLKIDEVGVMLLFDKPIEDIKSGLYFAPPGIISVKKAPGIVFQDELPADPENIFREDGKAPLGMFPPIRIKFGQPEHIQDPSKTNDLLKDDPYNIAMVAEVVPVVSWEIKSAMIFFEKMGTIENCRKILSDKAVEVFGDKFSNVTPAKALLTLGKTSEELEVKLRNETKDWGINIEDAYVKPFIFSHGLNTAVIKVSESTQLAKAKVIAAAATKTELMEEGAGKAEALKLLLEAQAIGTAKLAEICKTPEGTVTLWMETMGKAFEKANYSIIPGSELFSSVAGIKEMLEKVKGGGK